MNLKKHTTILLIGSFIFLVISLISCNYSNEYLKELDYKKIMGNINNKETFILYVSNTYCEHCKNFEPKLRNVANKYKINISKIDTATFSKNEHKDFLKIVGDLSTPAVLFFNNGKEESTTNRINGNVDEDKIIQKLKVNKYITD